MGKSSAAAARLHSAGGCIRLPAGRRAARVASSLSLVRSGQHGWPAARDQQPRAAQQHSWLQRLRSVEGLKNPTGTMADWLANAAPPQSMLVADLRAEIVARGKAPVGRASAADDSASDTGGGGRRGRDDA